jgi:hypothetical protein
MPGNCITGSFITCTVHQVKEVEMCSACNANETKRNACRILVGKSEGKRPLGRPRSRWEDNIKMDPREIG